MSRTTSRSFTRLCRTSRVSGRVARKARASTSEGTSRSGAQKEKGRFHDNIRSRDNHRRRGRSRLGIEPAAISGIYAANKVLGRTIDDNPTVRASHSTEPYIEPSGAKGMQATLESYGAVAADAGKSAAKVVTENKTSFIAGAAAAALACCTLLLRRRK